MHAIVTGYSGFVGSHLVPFLERKAIRITSLNLRDTGALTFPSDVDAVIHLAGKAHDHKDTAGPEEYFQVNTELTKAVFEHFLQSSAKTFIHFSTVAAVTDEHVDGILTEEAVPHPLNPYGQSKLQAEQFLLQAAIPADKKVFIIRPAMIHGPGDKGNLTLLYSIVSKGIPYPLAAFKNQRSFLSIDNLNYVVGKLLEQSSGVPSGIYNLVDDTPVATTEVVQWIAEVTRKKGKLWALPKPLARSIARIGDIIPLPINSKRLAKLTGNYIVANDKIKKALGIATLPMTAKEGLIKTITSFVSK